MNRAEFFSRLKRTAKRRYRVEITKSIFDDWRREKLLSAPEKHGRKREWGPKKYRIALEICRLKAQGVKFSGAQKWHLWIKGFQPPKFEPVENRAALLKEFRRLRKRATPRDSTYDARVDSTLSEWRAGSVARSLGEQDKRLEEIIPLTTSELIDGWGLARFDTGGQKLVVPLMEKVFESLGLQSLPEEIQKEIEKTLHQEISTLIGGYFGNPEDVENTAEETIHTASNESFHRARLINGLFPGVLRAWKNIDTRYGDGAESAARSAISPDWRIGNYISVLHAIVRSANSQNGRAIGHKKEG